MQSVSGNKTLTPDTLIKINMSGKSDTMQCRVCGEKEVIPFEYIGAGFNGMSLVLGAAGNRFRKGNPERRKHIKQFKQEHLIKCLSIPEKFCKKYL